MTETHILITPNPGWNDLNLHGLRRSRQRILNLYLDIYILYSIELSCMKTYIYNLYNYEAIVCVCVCVCGGGVLSCSDPEGGGEWKITSYMGFYRN